MAKTPLPSRDTWNYTLAVAIWEHIQPSNPHGPQADLYFEMSYVRDSAEQATRIANDLIAKGWREPLDPTRDDINLVIEDLIRRASGHVNEHGLRMDVDEVRRILRLAYDAGEHGRKEPITAEALEAAGPPTIVEPAKDIVSLVSGFSNETVDMTIRQALELNLLMGIKGHTSNLYTTAGDELWLQCSCRKYDRHVGSSDGIEEFSKMFREHLFEVLSTLTLADLPDGAYHDGTYEWHKDGDDWTPVRAPSGMPSKPERDKLKRVVKTYEEL